MPMEDKARERESDIYRQRDRQIERERDRQVERERERVIERDIGRKRGKERVKGVKGKGERQRIHKIKRE